MMPGWSNDIDGFTPDSETAEGGDNSSECINITLNPGDMYSLDVDNTPPPGGDAHTIGFWKNWTSCDGRGKQAAVLDDNLPVTLDTDFVIDKCPVAVDLLDKRKVKNEDIIKDGKKSASDPIYNMVAQLFAAKLNVNAGAGGCAALTNAITDADALLTDVGFDGNMDYKKGSDKLTRKQKAEANALAGTLDAYNNNQLCP
ncbi:hypothetical protein [Methyloprofundus sp.]|uniref:hypothetical protein n=1 Tax=Methyloprofundus sp. TaxID=2020875 RepID=UPI003D0B800D